MDKIFSNIKGRIVQFVDCMGIKKSEFFAKTGISASNFKGVGAKSEIGGEAIAKIMTIYKELNPIWLILGKGNMLIEDSKQQEPLPATSPETDAYYKMYEKKDAEASALKEEVGMLKERIKQLETKIPVGQIEQQRTIKETVL